MKRLIGVIVLLTVLFGLGMFREQVLGALGLPNASSNPFDSAANLALISREAAILGIYAIGAGIVIIAGGIDLSVGALVMWSGVMAIVLMGQGLSPWIACPLVVLACMMIGTAHGLLITKLNLQPFIITLAGAMIARGAAAVVTGGPAADLGGAYPEFKNLAKMLPGSWIYVPVVFVGVIAAAATVLMHFTVWGRYLFAIGRNEQAVLFSGIPLDRLKIFTYVLSAGLAGVAGLLAAANNEGHVGYADFMGFELWAVAGAVLGGVSLRGGEGTVPGILLGALAFPLLRTVMVFLGVPTTWEYVIVGLVLLGAVLVDEFIRRLEARRKAKPRTA